MDCERQFETRRSLDQRNDPVQCPYCSGWKARRVFSQPLISHQACSPTSRTDAAERFRGVTLTDCVAVGCWTGMVIGPGVSVRSRNNRFIDNMTGIDNSGDLDSRGDVIT